MSTIGLAPVRMREVTLAIEADNYTVSVNQVILTPQTEYRWEQPLTLSVADPFLTVTRWTLTLGFAQDFTSTGALSTYLVEHAGQQKTITLEVPGRVIAATVLILPAQLGGVANQIPSAVVTLPVYGHPDLGA